MALLEPDNHGTTQDTSRIECPRSTARDFLMVEGGMCLKQDSHVRLAKTFLEVHGLPNFGAIYHPRIDERVHIWET